MIGRALYQQPRSVVSKIAWMQQRYGNEQDNRPMEEAKAKKNAWCVYVCICVCLGSAASVPALLACLSRRPCRISSSSFRVRSSSSLSRLFPSSRMRTRKSLTSSDPSASCEVAIVVILFVYLFPNAGRTTRTKRVTPNTDKHKTSGRQ